jgi:hypothetical protein
MMSQAEPPAGGDRICLSGAVFPARQHHWLALSAQGSDAIMLEEIYLGWIFMHCLYYLGRAMPVISVTTRDPLHFNLGRDHFAIGAPVRFGPVTSMHFSRSLLSRRTANRAGPNPHWDCFRLWLDFIEHREVAGDAARIAGPSRLKEIAARAGVSPSTPPPVGVRWQLSPCARACPGRVCSAQAPQH